MGPPIQANKLFLILLLLLIVYYVFMDVSLYFRIEFYPLNKHMVGNSTVTYEQVAWINCNINPLCDITAKAVLLDHTNLYFFAPLVTIVDNLLHISDISFITPNSISIFHIFVAFLSAKCVCSDSIVQRRIGVFLFEFRTWLDDLDGHIARHRKHIKGERSEIGTAGYYIDGICDAIGSTALIIGIYLYLKRNPPRRGYVLLPTSVEPKKFKLPISTVISTLGFYVVQLVTSSVFWNRYIALYQDLLDEKNTVDPIVIAKQTTVFTSTMFYFIAWLWRVINVHSMTHCLLFAIFFDNLWEFLTFFRYIGFGLLFFVVCITEIHYIDARGFMFQSFDLNI